MRPITFVVYEDIKTLKDNFSVKVLLLSLFVISFLPYLILGRFSGLGSIISNPVSVLLIMMQLLVPYLAMRMSYKGISGEIRRNNHRLILTFPISRFDLVIGKWISRSVATAVAVVLHVFVSVVISTILYNPMNIQNVVWITIITVLLGAIFCSIGIAVSCTTNADSIIPDVLVTIVYVSLVFFWRLIPFSIKILIEGGGIENLPSGDYGGLEYLILRLNPLESYASIVSWGIRSDINILIPSSLRLPDVTNQRIIEYSVTPVKSSSIPIYAHELFTITLSVLIPILIMLYGYRKLKKRPL